MIHGIGVDIVELSRFTPFEGKWDDPFFRKIFTESERAEAARREIESGSRAALRYFASRFAVKEAVVKAFNTHEVAVEFPDIETLTLETGAPVTHLVGAAAPLENGLAVHVSISHEEQLAIAFAVVERLS